LIRNSIITDSILLGDIFLIPKGGIKTDLLAFEKYLRRISVIS